MKLFLIAGRARSGKTLAAQYLKEILDERKEKTVITEYSKYIKIFAKELLGWDGKSEPKPRTFLQDMGSYVRQNKSDTFFTGRMKEDIELYSHFVNNVIISDVRMPKEITEMRSFHPIKIKVVNDHSDYDLTAKQAGHETEHALDNYADFDYVLKNLSASQMKEKLRSIVEEIEE